MYKVKLDCIDPPYTEAPSQDVIDASFRNKDEAMIALLQAVIDEADGLNDAEPGNPDKLLIVTRNYKFKDKTYDAAVVVLWDKILGIRDQMLTGYFVEWVDENEVDFWNRKLRDKYGDCITVEICSEMGVADAEEDDVDDYPVFYFTSARHGDCDVRWATAKEAYDNAVEYMESLTD